MADQPGHPNRDGRRVVDNYRFSNWDRRSGFDRRRGGRRVKSTPVLVDRREKVDRREASRDRRIIPGANLPQPVGRFRQAAAILAPGVLQKRSNVHAPNFKVLARRGPKATVYSAWEEAEAMADGADYRPIKGRTYRRIGSALHVFESLYQIEEAERFYADECQRAYGIIYGQHPELHGNAMERDGEVIEQLNGSRR